MLELRRRYIKEKKRRSNKNFNQTRDNDVTKLDAFRDVAKKTKNLLDKVRVCQCLPGGPHALLTVL